MCLRKSLQISVGLFLSRKRGVLPRGCRTFICYLVLFFGAQSARALDDEQADDKFAAELAECSAYFEFTANMPGTKNVTREELFGTARDLLNRSIKLSSQMLAHARVALAMDTMIRAMDGKWSNVATINRTYASECNVVGRDPASRAKYWAEKSD